MKVKVKYECTTCSFATDEVLELPTAPSSDCPNCESEGTLYVTMIEEADNEN